MNWNKRYGRFKLDLITSHGYFILPDTNRTPLSEVSEAVITIKMRNLLLMLLCIPYS